MNKLMRLSVVTAFAVGLGLAGSAQAALVSITGGSATGSSPSGNSVLGPAGITFAGGSIIKNGTLRIGGDDVTLTLYFVGSESGWNDQIRLGNTEGASLYHTENFGAGGGLNPTPDTAIGSVTQDAGRANLRFYWTNPTPDKLLVRNGYSPPLISGQGRASLAFAYLNEFDQIVSDPTNRILVLLDDAFEIIPTRLRRLRRNPDGLDARAAACGCVAAALGSSRVRRRRSAAQDRDRLNPALNPGSIDCHLAE